MTTYDIIMIMLTCLTLIISLLTLVVRLLLIIIDKNAKNNYLVLGKSLR
ncbi:putative holin-like toxin [Catenibacterium mitsuokai]|nr:putative holin-like toxin [Catenibacterium mitsuokai]